MRPIPRAAARQLCEHKHYLRSYPGGSLLDIGAFAGNQLLGVAVLAVGPANIHRLFLEAKQEQVVDLSRLWLDDRLGRNSESRVLAIVVRLLRRHQSTIKALVAYSDPQVGHSGVVYRAAGFAYVGLSDSMPRYRLPDGSMLHSRSLSHAFGSHSRRHFAAHGVQLELVRQEAKHTYLACVDRSWAARLARPILPYPRQEDAQ
ncbi:MAG: DNA methyltransferase [Chloroflexi bacterium]|nr:DNA methyltransferase [Chloroflexota bacterium]